MQYEYTPIKVNDLLESCTFWPIFLDLRKEGGKYFGWKRDRQAILQPAIGSLLIEVGLKSTCWA